MDDARVYIWHIDEQWRANAKYRRVTINDDGTRTLFFTATTTSSRRTMPSLPSSESSRTLVTGTLMKRDHQIDLTEDQVVNDIYLKHRCGRGIIMTPEAIIFPMPLVSIDRKKPWIGYTLPSVRSVESGDNRTRGIAHHDEARIWWHEHIKSKKAAKAGGGQRLRAWRGGAQRGVGDPRGGRGL